ncbi:MAG: efflux RND transporter periplasmic adaptor subunit [Pseudomonadota bacterium]
MRMNRKGSKPYKGAMMLMILAVFLMPSGCNTGNSKQAAMPPQAPEVAVVVIETQPLELTTELPGRTSPFRIAEIRPQISGLILKRLFTEGSDVEAGQILYQTDPAPFQAALDNAEAALGRSEANLTSSRLRAERYNDLLADKAVSQQNYDDAVAALTQIEADIQYWKAAVKTARINLGYTKINSPISGRIGKSNVTDGAIITAYQPMALSTIQQLDPIYVDVPQSTTDLLRLKRRLKDGRLKKNGTDQDKVNLILEDGSPYPLEGTLQFSDITVDPTTGSVILRVVFPNPDNLILPGMFVQAVIKEGINDQAILIPQQGVSRDPKGNPIAMIVDAEGKVGLRMLTLDRAIRDKWLVSAGLAPGDRLIVEGLQKVRPGAMVRTVPFQEAQAGHDASTKGTDAASQKQDKGGA